MSDNYINLGAQIELDIAAHIANVAHWLPIYREKRISNFNARLRRW